jgi:hypothetical protein
VPINALIAKVGTGRNFVDDIVPLVYVVEQPDSPIEVVSVECFCRPSVRIPRSLGVQPSGVPAI